MVKRIIAFVAFAAVLLLTVQVYSTLISKDLPFFYHEDEAHHFGRVAQMTQTGDWNPRYFHKPSLHFYLRVPVHTAAFFWNVRGGSLRKIEDFTYRDKAAPGDWAFTTAHPSFVKWNRAFSFLLFLSTGLLVLASCRLLGFTLLSQFLTFTTFLLSPALLSQAAFIGVDIPVVFFCTLSLYFSLRARRDRSLLLLCVAAITAGLAISSKYNALPIAAVPVIAALSFFPAKIGSAVTLVIFSTASGFFLGSPYIFAEYPLFLNQFAYEIWHYGIAGHEGHSAEPGLDQAMFYLRFLSTDGLGGFIGFVLALIGGALLFAKDKRLFLLVAAYPALLFLLMSAQRANFSRNIISLIPFLCIFFGSAINLLSRKSRTISLLVSALILAWPGYVLLTRDAIFAQSPEARRALLSRVSDSPEKFYVSDELWLAPILREHPLSSSREVTTENAPRLFQEGADYLALPSYSEFEGSPFYRPTETLSGDPEKKRIVQNPEITLYASTSYEHNKSVAFILDTEELLPSVTVDDAGVRCGDSPMLSEDDTGCWVGSRLSRIVVETEERFRVWSPWKLQSLQIFRNNESYHKLALQGQWQELTLPPGEYLVESAEVLSPQKAKLSSDSRLLAFVIQQEENPENS